MTNFILILETYLTHYVKDKNGFIQMVGKLDVPVQIISSVYEIFVCRKELEPIENLTVEQKNRLWGIAKGFTEEKKKAVMICKSIYLLENCTE